MQTKVFLLKESRHNEKRVALIPGDVAKLINLGVMVYVEDSAGVGAGYSNADYLMVGAEIRQINYDQVESYRQAFSDINIIVRVKRPDRAREIIENQVINRIPKWWAYWIFLKEILNILQSTNRLKLNIIH